MSFNSVWLPADAGFWPAAGKSVRDFAARCDAPERRLQGITWLVPDGASATLARAALRDALGPVAFAPPRIAPVPAWLGKPMKAGMAARAEIYAALRGNAWIREAFGDQAAMLWSFARDVAQLSDELTWAAMEGNEAFEGRLTAALARHFHRRAALALRPQSQLVLQLWRARREVADGAAGAWRELDARANRATSPLVYLSTLTDSAPPADGLASWERAFLQRWSQRSPVLLIVPDLRGALAREPLLVAAWPELSGRDTDVPIAQRADVVRLRAEAMRTPLAIVAADSLEEEATAAARQVLAWRRDGIESIGLVALDRLTARRVRALLERAQVIVRDETGWKLSTTSAASAVMRWYDLVADDMYWRDLLDWLKSSFTLAGWPDKAQLIHSFERAIRGVGAVQGVRAMRLALAELQRDSPEHAARARAVLELLETQMQTMRRAGPTLSAHARALQGALEALGMRAALALDPVGLDVLREIDTLESELAAAGGRARLEEFRALLAARFEEASTVDREVESTVTMLSLAAAALRPYDAVLLIGADADHLPTAPSELLFFSNDVRAELGLATADDARREQSIQLASLLATVPRVVATWRRRHGEEANLISPLLERLRLVARRATGDDLTREVECDAVVAQATPLERPAPSAGRLLPSRLSASHAQSLVDCPYQFYARRLLGLDSLEDVIEAPGKREFGEALHEILRRFHREWGAADFGAIDATDLRGSLERHAREVFGREAERLPGMLAYERRFLGLIDGYLAWLRRHSAGGWRWAHAEQSGERSLGLEDGRELMLTGRFDRVDQRADGAVMIVDYKARSADDLKRGLTVPGEDIQLPFYGLLMRDSSANRGQIEAAYLAFDRGRENAAGVQLVGAPAFDELVDAVDARLRRDLQRIADGSPLPALGRQATCQYCEMRGLCRRDYWEHGEENEA